MSNLNKIQKLSLREHVLHSPDTYIGSADMQSTEMWVLDENESMKKKIVSYIPGEFKLFDEILVNAGDQYVRLEEDNDDTIHKVKNIKINVDKENGIISVYNDGEGISSEIHPKEKKHIVELIFANLLTSENYNKAEIKHVGGKNGYGAKLTNIYSTYFKVETIDSRNNKKYVQIFEDNMTKINKPTITKCSKNPYTQITYKTDYTKLNTDNLTDDMVDLIKKRVYDLSAYTNSKVNIYYNDKKINVRNFDKYVDLYIGNKKDNDRAYEKVNERWEVCATLNPNLTFEQISFVNGICTLNGGKHVEYVCNQICKKLSEYIKLKKKVEIKPNYIRENLILFINSTIDNPSFNSQTKEVLTTNKNKFGSNCELSKKFIEKLAKCGIMEKAMDLALAKDNKKIAKTDGKKQNHIKGIPKLEDANKAGTKESDKCTIIFTEGDSAKAMAMAGLSIIGRDYYGVFPLKGKVLNVADIKNIKKIFENVEINSLKKIMGLEANKVYTSTKDLRYGKILLLCDADEDGSHIKGLMFNLFKILWPSLFELDGFLNGLLTPIVKASKGKKIKKFYSVKDYDTWKENNDTKGWHCKYYKGLGTSTPAEAREIFSDFHLLKYTVKDIEDKDSITLAFGKEEQSADNRKKWLQTYKKSETLDYSCKNISMSQFVNYDLKHFSNSDNERSIPNLIDGLKKSQRKVLFTGLKRNLQNEIRVAQFSGSVSEMSAYHHGEASLNSTIVNMAQDYVGSNNINLFEPIGQFGSRLQGGKDSAQPRYIHTKLNDITKYIFHEDDMKLLDYNDDDGVLVEPIYYVPIIPMILVNGCSGIGTGWSTEIPCYNPSDIISNIKNTLELKSYVPMHPFYRKFKGNIIQNGNTNYRTSGKYEILKDCIHITELPLNLWTDKFKEHLETLIIDPKVTNKKLLNKQFIKYYESQCSDDTIDFKIYFNKHKIDINKIDTDFTPHIEKILKMHTNISTTNMVLYDENERLVKYNNVEQILKQFINVRLDYYQRRKDFKIDVLTKDINLLELKIRFINEFIEGIILINNKTKIEIETQLINNNYPKINDTYDYLLKMPIYNLIKDKIDEFNNILQTKHIELNSLKKETPKSLWLEDLNILEQKLKKNFNSLSKKKLKIKKKINEYK